MEKIPEFNNSVTFEEDSDIQHLKSGDDSYTSGDYIEDGDHFKRILTGTEGN